MNNNNVISRVILSLIIQTIYAQFTISAELRPRGEDRHGYSTILSEDEDPAFFVAQRTRLNAQHKTEKLEKFVSFQNVCVWGDISVTLGMLLEQDLNKSNKVNHTSKISDRWAIWGEENKSDY